MKCMHDDAFYSHSYKISVVGLFRAVYRNSGIALMQQSRYFCFMEIAGYIAAVLIGLSLGLIGGGGSVLTVPVFVYMLHVNPVLATTYSLFVVGSCSLVGGARAYSKGLVNYQVVLYFGLSSMLSVFI